MTRADADISIEQTIHGYRDGHELLASSMQLSSAARRAMLALSDLSGDGGPRGFEEYLTGYPLEEAAMYAFARTWYASEMSRPGCVWTHTLLIRLDDLGLVPSLAALRRYFRRPDNNRIPSSLPTLRHTLDDSSAENANVQLDGASYEIVVRLYGQGAPVLIFGDNSTQYEDTFIEVWAQQWERLRRSFAFCTGSLEPRTVEKRPFDLQVIPQQRQRKTLRSAEKFSIVTDEDILRSTGVAARVRDALTQISPLKEKVLSLPFELGEERDHLLRQVGESQLWPDIILQDLVRRNAAMHSFVETYSQDVPIRRTAYRDLIECWALVESIDAVGTSLRDLTRAIAQAFPSKAEAAHLKRATLGRASVVRGAKEADLVHELLTLPHPEALDATDLEVESRAEQMFREGNRWRASEIAWLLTTTDLNEIGREWATSLLENLTIDDLSGLFGEDRELFTTLLRDRPALLTNERLWQQPRELQRSAAKVLSSVESQARRQDAINAIVAANAAGLVETLVQELGSSAIGSVLTALDQCHRELRDLDEWQWSTSLRGYDPQLVDWLNSVEQPAPWTLVFVVGLLGVHSNVLAGTSNLTFERHLHLAMSNDETSVIDYAAYCLTIALRNFNGNAGPLAVSAFQPVHEAALRSRVSRRAWQWLAPSLPRPGWLSVENWDDGEKVRRALVESFLRHRWDPTLLCDAATTEQSRRWIIRFCESFDSGQELLRRAGLR